MDKRLISRHYDVTDFDAWSKAGVSFPYFDSAYFEDKSVLDIGCSNGANLAVLEKNGANTFGIDASKNLLDVASGNAKKTSFVCGDAFSLPFKNQKFDCVVCIGLVEHFGYKFIEILNEIKRVLKPKGLAFIRVVNKFSVMGIFSIEKKWYPTFFYLMPHQFKHMVKKTGMHIKKIDFFSISIPFQKISRIRLPLRILSRLRLNLTSKDASLKTPLKIFGRYYFVACEKPAR